MKGSKILYTIAAVISITLFVLIAYREKTYECSVLATTPDYCFPTIVEQYAAVLFLAALGVGLILNLIEYIGEKKRDRNRK